MTKHLLPALAALTLVVAGPQRARFEAIHAPRAVLMLALAALLLAAGRLGRVGFGAVEWLAGACLAAMALSALFASSPAYALEPLALAAAAGAVLLGTAWRDAERPLWVRWLAAAVIAVAVLGLLEALGAGPRSLPGRAPSATMGQRNALAHFLLLGSPVVWCLGARAGSLRARVGLWAAAALLGAVLLATRSRAAWVSLLPVLACFVALERSRRAVPPALCVLGGAVLAAAAPAVLAWSHPHPYADTLARLLDFERGSGAGRLAEWKASLALFTGAPVLGVGPGNWFVEYGLRHGGAHFAHSDAVGLLVERGLLGAALLLALAGAAAFRWRRSPELPVVAATAVAAIGVGALDTVLQLPAPLLLVSLVFFVGSRPGGPVVKSPWGAAPFALAAVRMGCVTASLWLSTAERIPFERLELAARLDPLDGELRFTLAEAWTSAGDCERARAHVEALRRLLPRHPKLAALEAACGQRQSE